MRRTTQQTLLAINLASQQKTTKLYFSSQVRKRFHLSHYAVVCEMINLWIAMFENSAKIYFLTYAWFDLSIKLYFLMVFSLILLRSLRVYIVKQLFFSISVNSGFKNIYPAAFAARQIFSHYSPRLQRIIVHYYIIHFKIFLRFWLAKIQGISHHNQLLWSKIWKNFAILNWWRQVWSKIDRLSNR